MKSWSLLKTKMGVYGKNCCMVVFPSTVAFELGKADHSATNSSDNKARSHQGMEENGLHFPTWSYIAAQQPPKT